MSDPSARSGLLALAAAALDGLIAAGGPLPGGFRLHEGRLRFTLTRDERYGDRSVTLAAGMTVTAEALVEALARGAKNGLEALEASAADWASDFSHDLDDLHDELAPAVTSVLAAASALEAPELAASVLDRLPAVIDYEQRVAAIEPFRQAARGLLRRAVGARLRALDRGEGLPPPVVGVDEKNHKFTLRLRRSLDVTLLGAPLPLVIESQRPLAASEADDLAWAGDEAGVKAELLQMLGPEEAILLRELHRAARYADLLFNQDSTVDREAIARALTQVAARGGEFDAYKLQLGQLAARARAEKFRADVAELERHRNHYADVGGYYPLARSLRRRIELFVGPTNSGKTFRALNALVEGESGTYLAPLRLLALEGQGEVERRGKPCSYLTGEERDMRAGARFASSTIEMLDFRHPVDAVLIDEIQLLADPSRGWAWTAALIGAPARRVLLTGAPGCRAAVERIAEMLGEEVIVTETERLAPLEVEKRPTALSKLTPGTAVIAFARRDVLDLKATIEQSTGLRCSVIYGNLSPRVRREEARRFREGEADILVSTDAIAMGLNLPIERVVFFTTTKFDGQRERLLSDHEILQIGGRAGRYGKADRGSVTALTRDDQTAVQAAFQRGPGPIGPPFRVMPDERHVELLGQVLGTASLERILVFFSQAITFDADVFLPADLTDLCALAAVVDRKLPMSDAHTRLIFASAPVEATNEPMLRAWERMMDGYAANDESRLLDLFEVEALRHQRMTTDPLELLSVETHLKILTIYSWLAYRFPAVYRSLDSCDVAKDVLAGFIEESLRGRAVRRCSSCGVVLPIGFRFGKCNACFRGGDGEGPRLPRKNFGPKPPPGRRGARR